MGGVEHAWLAVIAALEREGGLPNCLNAANPGTLRPPPSEALWECSLRTVIRGRLSGRVSHWRVCVRHEHGEQQRGGRRDAPHPASNRARRASGGACHGCAVFRHAYLSGVPWDGLWAAYFGLAVSLLRAQLARPGDPPCRVGTRARGESLCLPPPQCHSAAGGDGHTQEQHMCLPFARHGPAHQYACALSAVNVPRGHPLHLCREP